MGRLINKLDKKTLNQRSDIDTSYISHADNFNNENFIINIFLIKVSAFYCTAKNSVGLVAFII